MRRLPTVLPLALGFVTAVSVMPGPAAGQDAPPQQPAPQQEEEAEDTGQPVTKTEVIGEVPVDLRGIWLLVTHGQVGTVEGKVRNGADLYAGRGSDGNMSFELYLRELPEDMRDAVKTANKTLTPWNPSDQQLAALGQKLDTLPPIDPERFLKHVVKVVGPSAYGTAFKGDVQTILADTQFALDLEHQYRPQAAKDQMAQLMLDKGILGAKQTSPALYQGSQLRTLLAAGFAPIPITTRGPFWLYRVRGPESMPSDGGAGSGSWLSRFWSSLTRGCR
jgi:hypothetical protein